MKSSRIAHNAMGAVACLIAAATMASQPANAQSGAEIARQVVSSSVASIVQSARDRIQTDRTLKEPHSSSVRSSRERRARNAVSHREGT